jgi:hypothetical protein
MLSNWPARARICKPLKGLGIDSKPGGPVRQPYLSYLPAKLHRLRNRFFRIDFWAPSTFTNMGSGYIGWREEFNPWNRFLGSIIVQKYRLWVVVSSAEWFGTEFREFTSILVPRNGIPSCVLFRRTVRNRIMAVCFYYCSTERNSELFSLPRKGSEQPEFRRK